MQYARYKSRGCFYFNKYQFSKYHHKTVGFENSCHHLRTNEAILSKIKKIKAVKSPASARRKNANFMKWLMGLYGCISYGLWLMGYGCVK